MHKCTFEVALTLRAPILTHGLETAGFGVDMATRKYQNSPVLNGSLIRGNLRHSWLYFAEKIADHMHDQGVSLCKEDISRWLGQESSKGVNAARGSLNFDYFWMLDKNSVNGSKNNDSVRYRIGINDGTGIAETGNLQLIESVFATGEKPCFKGRINAWLETEAEARQLSHWLNKAFQYISGIGALKGVGFGKLLHTNITQLENEKLESVPIPSEANCIGIEIYPDRPICIARAHLPDSNRFVSEDFISGAVLKGAFARQYTQYNPDASLTDDLDFENIYFSHALPGHCSIPARPLPMPLSLCIADGQVIDMALQAGHCLLLKRIADTGSGPDQKKYKEVYIAPAFSPDWKQKHRTMINQRLQQVGFSTQPGTQRLLSVRTAINSKTGSAAQHKLFSFECVDHHISVAGDAENENDTAGISYVNGRTEANANEISPADIFPVTEKACWRAEINLGKVNAEKKAGIARALSDMLIDSGLGDIGKTRAVADIRISDTFERKPCSESHLEALDNVQNEPCYIIMLRTQARMLPANHCIPGTNGHLQLQKAYNDYFNYISGGVLALSHFYAQQQLYGGHFYQQYYRKNTTDYRPEWLSVPGSVFVLKVVSEEKQSEAVALLQNWLETGLPVAEDREQDNWQTDPLLPQNGYGEIVINHSIHTELAKPETGELK